MISKILMPQQQALYKGPDKREHIVEDTLLPTQMFPRLPAFAQPKETSWAAMCLQQCVLVYQGFKEYFVRHLSDIYKKE